jgi:hypothetical protein
MNLRKIRIAQRLNIEEETVEFFVEDFRHTGMVPVIDYLERRIANMKGDENVKDELEQIRLDLAALSTPGVVKPVVENPDGIL